MVGINGGEFRVRKCGEKNENWIGVWSSFMRILIKKKFEFSGRPALKRAGCPPECKFPADGRHLKSQTSARPAFLLPAILFLLLFFILFLIFCVFIN